MPKLILMQCGVERRKQAPLLDELGIAMIKIAVMCLEARNEALAQAIRGAK